MACSFQQLLAALVLSVGSTVAIASPATSPCVAPSPPVGAEAIDRMVMQAVLADGVPGMSIVVLEGGKVRKLRGYGFADLESCLPASAGTLFGIGSVSKQFTAVGALALVRDGVLSLDDSIVKYLPEGKGRWDDISVRDLLAHTSGIPDYCEDDPKYPSIHLDRTSSPTTPDLLREIARAPLNFAPGTDWAYSNTGYVVLSVVIERAAGQPFQAYMRDHVFAPLGMTATRYSSPLELIPHRAAPYHTSHEGVTTHGPFISDQFSHWGDMGMLSTAVDMGRWASAIGSDPLLPAALWRQMLSPVQLEDGTRMPYGFGIQLGEAGGQPVWFHAGTFRAGYSAMFLVFPKDHLAVATQSNFWGGASPARDVALAIVGALDPTRAPAATRAPVPDPQPRLTAALLKTLQGLDRAHGASGYTTAFRQHNDLDKGLAHLLTEEAPGATLRYIDCHAAAGTPPDALGSVVARTCMYRIEGVPEQLDLVLWLTDTDHVAGLSFW